MKLKTHDDRLTLTNGTYHSLVNTGHTVTGGIVTAVDSSWLMSWTINRQEQYYGQPEKLKKMFLSGYMVCLLMFLEIILKNL